MDCQAVLFDLDGTIYQGDELIEGAEAALAYLKTQSIPCRFITNTTRMTKNNLLQILAKMGLELKVEDVFAAPHAAVEYCKLNGLVNLRLIVPDEEMIEDFLEFNLKSENPEAVILGDMGNLFNHELLNKIFIDILNGAVLIAMHKNRFWRSKDGLTLDLGAYISALEYAAGKEAVVVGKPNRNFFHLASRHWDISSEKILVVGDDLDGDVGGAFNSKMKSVLVKTGKFLEDNLQRAKVQPDYIINSVADLPALFQSI